MENENEIYYLTFGKKYPWHDGYVEVYANSYSIAKRKVRDILGESWAWLFKSEEFNKKDYKLGKIGEIK